MVVIDGKERDSFVCQGLRGGVRRSVYISTRGVLGDGRRLTSVFHKTRVTVSTFTVESGLSLL